MTVKTLSNGVVLSTLFAFVLVYDLVHSRLNVELF